MVWIYNINNIIYLLSIIILIIIYLVSTVDQEIKMKKTAITALRVTIATGSGLDTHYYQRNIPLTDFTEENNINADEVESGDIYIQISKPNPARNTYLVNYVVNNSNNNVYPEVVRTPYYYYKLSNLYTVTNSPILFLASLLKTDGSIALQIENSKIAANDYEKGMFSLDNSYYSLIFNENDIPSDIETENIQGTKNVTITSNHDAVNPLIIEPDEGFESMAAVAAVVEVPQATIEQNKSVTYNGNGTYSLLPSSGYDAISDATVNVAVPLQAQKNYNYYTSDYTGTNEFKTIQNVIAPGSGYTAMQSAKYFTKLAYVTITSNGTYDPTDFYTASQISQNSISGFYKINVNVPTNIVSFNSVMLYYYDGTSTSATSNNFTVNISEMNTATGSAMSIPSGYGLFYITSGSTNPIYYVSIYNNNSGSSYSYTVGAGTKYLLQPAKFFYSVYIPDFGEILGTARFNGNNDPCLGYRISTRLYKSMFNIPSLP